MQLCEPGPWGRSQQVLVGGMAAPSGCQPASSMQTYRPCMGAFPHCLRSICTRLSLVLQCACQQGRAPLHVQHLSGAALLLQVSRAGAALARARTYSTGSSWQVQWGQQAFLYSRIGVALSRQGRVVKKAV